MSLSSRDLYNLHRQMNSMFDLMHQTYGSNEMDIDEFIAPTFYSLPMLAAGGVQSKDASAMIPSANKSADLTNKISQHLSTPRQHGSLFNNNSLLSMSMDVHATPDSYKVSCEMPGVDKPTIDISADKRTNALTIKAEKRSGFTETDQQQKQGTSSSTDTSPTSTGTGIGAINQQQKKDAGQQMTTTNTNDLGRPRVIRQERSYGLIQRSVRLAADADLDHIVAKYENGVLNLTVPRIKHPEFQAKKITVQ